MKDDGGAGAFFDGDAGGVFAGAGAYPGITGAGAGADIRADESIVSDGAQIGS